MRKVQVSIYDPRRSTGTLCHLRKNLVLLSIFDSHIKILCLRLFRGQSTPTRCADIWTGKQDVFERHRLDLTVDQHRLEIQVGPCLYAGNDHSARSSHLMFVFTPSRSFEKSSVDGTAGEVLEGAGRKKVGNEMGSLTEALWFYDSVYLPPEVKKFNMEQLDQKQLTEQGTADSVTVRYSVRPKELFARHQTINLCHQYKRT
ncbi:MAG: hypothetical protein NXY57DRAFT_87441 [Lentinula lateritia]|nr:MAG: hypothetical protein NXY57DRAFT_87441 [Lentinula lateritia]